MNSKSTNGDPDISNVVLISFDSLRSDYIANLAPDEAPNICLLRDQGVFFKNTIVQAPFTIPSHASMLTGLYPAKTGVRDMHHRVPVTLPTVFSISKDKGFSTVFATPTSSFAHRGFQGIDQRVPLSHRKLAKVMGKLRGGQFFAFLHYWDTHTPYKTWLPIAGPIDILLNTIVPLIETARFGQIRYLQRIADFLWLMKIKRIRVMMKTEASRIVPAIQKGYKRAIVKADKFVGQILRTIERIGLSDKTLLVITGDHGDSFNEHNEIGRAVDSRYEHGQFLYDNVIKVPLIFFCAQRRFSVVFDHQVQQIDIVPTLLQALKIQYDGDLDGTALWDRNIVKAREPESSLAFSEIVRESLGMELRCVRSNSYKLIHDYKSNKSELYDLRKDPQEKDDLYPGDGCSEKDALLSELQSFSRIGSAAEASYTEQERQQIERTLRNLGYMD
jgi:arylsulfatase A-like enzyme